MTALFNDVLMLLFEGMTRGSIDGGTNQLTLITITNHSDGKKITSLLLSTSAAANRLAVNEQAAFKAKLEAE